MGKLQNDSAFFNVVNLDPDHPGKGPFMVLQMANDPDDPVFTERCFVLTREGTWIKLLEILGSKGGLIPRTVYETFSEVGVVLENLSGGAEIERIGVSFEDAAAKWRQIEGVGGLRAYLRDVLNSR